MGHADEPRWELPSRNIWNDTLALDIAQLPNGQNNNSTGVFLLQQASLNIIVAEECPPCFVGDTVIYRTELNEIPDLVILSLQFLPCCVVL